MIKKKKIVLGLVVAMLLMVGFVYNNYMTGANLLNSTLVFSETSKNGQHQCQISNWRFTERMKFLFDDFEYTLSEQILVGEVKKKWLIEDRALYLSMVIEYHDGFFLIHEEISPVDVEIIYDFQTKESYINSGLTLWRGTENRENRLNEDEFEEIKIGYASFRSEP